MLHIHTTGIHPNFINDAVSHNLNITYDPPTKVITLHHHTTHERDTCIQLLHHHTISIIAIHEKP